MIRVAPAVLLVTMLGSYAVVAGEPPRGAVHADVPSSIDPSRHYVFYLHGRIVEIQGRKASHPKHGSYDYDGIAKALAERGAIVISEVRPADTTIEYSGKIAAQVKKLLAASVPASHITVAGHSKGGLLALHACAAVGDAGVRYVIMAGCIDAFDIASIAPRLKGRLLSIYDSSDREAGSCKPSLQDAKGLVWEEVVTETGLGHGLFYRPRAEWVDRLVAFAMPR